MTQFSEGPTPSPLIREGGGSNYGKAHLLISVKSLFKLIASKFTSWTMENKEIPSTKNFRLKVKPSDKSLIYWKE